MQASETTIDPIPVTANMELISAIQDKDSKAFSRLYSSYSGCLFIIIKKIVQSQEVAEDILQNSFLKIYNNFHRYDSRKGGLFSWMSTIARNESFDYLRGRNARKEALTTTVYGDIAVAPGFSDPVYDLHRCFGKLAYQQRKLIFLYLNGHTCDEISVLIAAPVGTVKSRMRVIYKQIRDNYN